MNNPWLKISLDDYESHMSLPSIAQAQYLSSFLEKLLNSYNPQSLALIGCAGGNGLEKINPSQIQKVVCVDINSGFIETAKKRFVSVFKNIEFVTADIVSDECRFSPVELIFAGLLFEYVDNSAALNNIIKHLEPNGKLAVILQLPNPDIPEVSPSPFNSLEKLIELFSFVSPDKLIELCLLKGLDLILQSRTGLNSGKEFMELVFQKNHSSV